MQALVQGLPDVSTIARAAASTRRDLGATEALANRDRSSHDPAESPPGRRRRRRITGGSPLEDISGLPGLGYGEAGNGITLRMAWHPAAEPETPEDDETFHDNWRRAREQELWKDQFLTPGR